MIKQQTTAGKKKCQKQLKEAELKVNKLLDDGSLEESEKT